MLARQLCQRRAVFHIADSKGKSTLHRRRAGQKLPPDADQCDRRQRPVVTTDQPSEDRGFTPGPECGGLAGARHIFDDLCPLHQQVMNRIVDPIEFGS